METESSFVMRIRDNGVWIADSELHNPMSHGIRGMRERAQMLGGTLSLTGEAGEGTTVIVSLPRLAATRLVTADRSVTR